MEYTFIKIVNLTMINKEFLAIGVNSLFTSVSLNGNILTIHTLRALSKVEFDKVHKVVSNHKAPTSLEVEAKVKMIGAITFGQSIILEVATENVLLKLSTDQIMQMLIKFGGIKQMLESGSLHTALNAMQMIPADPILMPQARIDKYVNKIKAYLGI